MELQGEQVLIRSTSQDDLENLMGLWNDGRVMQWVGYPGGLGYDWEAVQDWYENLQENSQRHHFVVLVDGMGFCGEVYYVVDELHRRAGLDIKLRPEAQGMGLAIDILYTLIQHVFKVESGVDCVWTQPSENNTAAQALYARCGLTPKARPADIENGESYWELTRTQHDFQS